MTSGGSAASGITMMTTGGSAASGITMTMTGGSAASGGITMMMAGPPIVGTREAGTSSHLTEPLRAVRRARNR
jgi:hypothetical protein